MSSNGWQLFYYKVFKLALNDLEAIVAKLAVADPIEYKKHPKTKLLASVYLAVTKIVPMNPNAPIFRPGNTLGRGNANWRRVKSGMPDRYRLFFRFSSSPVPLIVYVWFNDDGSLRKAGAKTDVYETFKRMLASGRVPSSIDDLLSQSAPV